MCNNPVVTPYLLMFIMGLRISGEYTHVSKVRKSTYNPSCLEELQLAFYSEGKQHPVREGYHI